MHTKAQRERRRVLNRASAARYSAKRQEEVLTLRRELVLCRRDIALLKRSNKLLCIEIGRLRASPWGIQSDANA